MIDLHDNKIFDLFEFPGGEVGIKWKFDLLKDTGLPGMHYSIKARINNSLDLLKLLTVVNAFNHMGCVGNVLYIPYFPGARQDRVADLGDPLSVEVYADIINSLNFKQVQIIDPHSDVTPAVIKNCNILPVNSILEQIVTEGGYNTILIPDAGAGKKTFSYYFPLASTTILEANGHKLNFVQCLKKRDTVTGKLTGFRIIDEIPEDARCLIVDDICDGGGTFLGLAKELPPVEMLGLYVTHGIFSKGVDILLGEFDRLYTTNSIKDIKYEQPEVEVFNI